MLPMINCNDLGKTVEDTARFIGGNYSPYKTTVIVVDGPTFRFVPEVLRKVNPRTVGHVLTGSGRGLDLAVARASVDALPVEDLADKNVVLVDDAIETGATLHSLTEMLLARGALSVDACVMLLKRGCRRYPVEPKLCGYTVDKVTLAGYGLDYKGRYRNEGYVGVPPELVKDGRKPRPPMKWMTDSGDRW